jgi:tRNA(fMet)-specific endonuclease VapC
MAQPRALIDTDVLSALLRGTSAVAARARDYLGEHRIFALSIITRYEILRGLKAKAAVAQVQAFDRFCATCLVMPVTDDVVVRAADIYATLRSRGEPIGDADILFAATALTHGCGVVTNNESHFRRIDGLGVDNWIPA